MVNKLDIEVGDRVMLIKPANESNCRPEPIFTTVTDISEYKTGTVIDTEIEDDLVEGEFYTIEHILEGFKYA